MSKKHIWIAALGVLLVLNVAMIALRKRNDTKWMAVRDEVRARETQGISSGLRAAPAFASNLPFGLIGDLVKSLRWKKVLPLAPAQASAIMKLDDLLRKVRYHSMRVDADYLDGNPADYREYMARNGARRSEISYSARRMVSLGLLTGPQEAFVTHYHLSGVRPLHTLQDANVKVMLEFTQRQDVELAKVLNACNTRQGRMQLMSADPEVKKRVRAEMDANLRDTDAAAMKILTPRQHEIWSQLTAERSLPEEPPDVPALSDADAARIKLEELSPVFRVLGEKANALKLSDEQRGFLKDLEEVTKTGWLWIGLGNRAGPYPPGDARNDPIDPIAQTRAEFLKHAEQVALLGILTEKQAEQVQAAIKKN